MMFEESGRIQLTSLRFSPAGSMRGLGSVRVEISEALSEPSGDTNLALKLIVEAPSEDDYPDSETSMIDYFEIEEVIASLASLAKLSQRKHAFASFHNSFTSKGGINFVIFNDQRGRTNFSVRIESACAYFNEVRKLEELSAMLSKAKEKLVGCASSPPPL
jgi:hypothetical protein